jgi:polyisoprenyl-phosphate glycosyltransferase
MSKTSDLGFSIVIPVYNAEHTLTELCERILTVFRQLKFNYEIIFVDDYSKDHSWEILEHLSSKVSQVKAIRLRKNYGQHSAVLCGLKNASGDYIITMDDDLQNPPEEIPNLITAIIDRPEIDIVIGVPEQKNHSFFRRLGSFLINEITTIIFKKERQLKMASFRIMSRDLAQDLISLNIPEPAIGTMILILTKNIENILVKHNPRAAGRSGYSFGKLLKLTFNNIISYSSLPLKIVSHIGLISAFISMIMAIYFLIRVRFVTVSGWVSTVVLISFFSGLILFSLGIIGEYLIRILISVYDFPQYLMLQKRGFDNNERQ